MLFMTVWSLWQAGSVGATPGGALKHCLSVTALNDLTTIKG